MKKIFLTLILFVSILLTGCSSNKITKLSLDELKEKINNKESLVIYFSKEETTLDKVLEKIVEEYNLTIYKVETNKLTDEEKIDFQPTITFEEPSIVFVINGVDSSKLSHVTSTSTTKNQIISRLKDMNFIKEEK